MAGEVSELVADLKALRKGRGLTVGRIGERIGPRLRQVCGLTEADSPAEIRSKVADRLTSLTAMLPDDLRVAVQAAFGIHPLARHPFYQDRVRWAAGQLQRDERTARRRVDVGIEALAELAVSRSEPPARPELHASAWHTRKLWVSLSLDLESPEAFEYRRIVADRDGVGELDLSLTLTAAHRVVASSARELGIDVFHGGRLVHRRLESSDRIAFALNLPRRLSRGETHDYAVRFRVPPHQVMQPHYVCLPKQRCEAFDLSVRFAQARLPSRVWRLTNAFQRDVDDPALGSGDVVSLDAAHEVHLAFEQLAPGLAYGVRWELAADLPAADPGQPNGHSHQAQHADH